MWYAQNADDDDRRDECPVCRHRRRHAWDCPVLREESEAEVSERRTGRKDWHPSDP